MKNLFLNRHTAATTTKMLKKKKRDVFSGTHKIALLTVLCLVVLSKALTISHFACMCVFIRILYVLKYTFFFSEWGRQRNSFRTYHFWEEKKKPRISFFFFSLPEVHAAAFYLPFECACVCVSVCISVCVLKADQKVAMPFNARNETCTLHSCALSQ